MPDFLGSEAHNQLLSTLSTIGSRLSRLERRLDDLEKRAIVLDNFSSLRIHVDKLNARVFENAPSVGLRDGMHSTLRDFVLEKCELGPDYRVGISELYEHWVCFAGRRSLVPPPISVFGRNLKSLIFGLTAVQARDQIGKKPRSYIGVRLRPQSPIEDKPASEYETVAWADWQPKDDQSPQEEDEQPDFS